MSSHIVDDQLIHSDGETEAEFKKGSKWRASLRQGLKKTRKLTSTIKQTTQEQLQKINEKRNQRDDKVITGFENRTKIDILDWLIWTAAAINLIDAWNEHPSGIEIETLFI